MGSTAPCPTLLKVWISWWKGGLLLRVLGLPAALLALHLEIYGSSPHATSLILHRLSRRLRLDNFACKLRKHNKTKEPQSNDRKRDVSAISKQTGNTVMAPALSRPSSKSPNWLSRKPSKTPDSKDRARRPSPGASPASNSPNFKPQPLSVQHPEVPDARLTSSPSLPSTPSPSPPPRPLLIELAESSDAPSPTSPPALTPISQPTSLKQLEASTLKKSEASTALKNPEASTPIPHLQPITVKPIEAPHAPLPNTSAARASLTPRPQPPPVDQVEALNVPSSTAAAPAGPERQPTLLELEIFKDLLRSTSPPSPSPDSRPLPVGRSKTSDVRLCNASVSRSSIIPKPQPHPSDAEAFEKFKALLRTSTGFPAFASPKFSPPMTLDNSEASSSPSTASSIHTRSRPSPSTPSTPMSARPSSHSRSMSHASAVTRSSKRLSLQFPIQPSPTFTPKLRPQSWVAAPSPMSPAAVEETPTENSLLAILAAQERYVLELKEELVKAEEDLKTLKKHWTNNEIFKQRNETRKVTQLQPVNTSLANLKADLEDEDGSNVWLQREMERRKALLNSQRPAKNKVFSGSRHLRTLSLLSPDTLTANYQPSFPQPLDIRDGIDESLARPHTLIRHATTPDLARHIAEAHDDDSFDLHGLTTVQRDAIVRTGKKMATDFKEGLFNFIDDIRQATVGEEAINDGAEPLMVKGTSTKNTRKASDGRPPLKRAPSTKKSSSKKIDAIADDFWKEHGLNEPKFAPANKITHAIKNTRTPQKDIKGLEEFEDWDNWDTPNDKYTTTAMDTHSSDDSEEPSSPVSGPSSSRTSTRYHSQRHDSKASSLTDCSTTGPADDALLRDNTKRNSIPWPDLVKLSPTNLKRTASHLMKEWEKTLTPPPESRVSDHSSGDYVGRSTSGPETGLI